MNDNVKQENNILESKLEKLMGLHDSFKNKEKFHGMKWKRARSTASSDSHFEKKNTYRSLDQRTVDLIRHIRKQHTGKSIADWVDAKWIRDEFRWRLVKKEEGKKNFLTKHRYSIMFMQSSLDADYGTFTCDKCGCTFYHSPSCISLAGKDVYKCCCGYCTNRIIQTDWDQTPYY